MNGIFFKDNKAEEHQKKAILKQNVISSNYKLQLQYKHLYEQAII